MWHKLTFQHQRFPENFQQFKEKTFTYWHKCIEFTVEINLVIFLSFLINFMRSKKNRCFAHTFGDTNIRNCSSFALIS